MEDVNFTTTEENELLEDEGDFDPDVFKTIRFVMPQMLEEEYLESIMDTDEYQKGVMLAAKWGGFYTTLINFGLSTEEALGLTINQQTADNNTEVSKTVKRQNPLG